MEEADVIIAFAFGNRPPQGGGALSRAELRRQRPGGPGVASVVGFHDHLKRCVLTTRANDMTAYAPHGYAMPDTYDPESGQVWTRYRPVHLVTDMVGRLTLLQRELAEEATWNGD